MKTLLSSVAVLWVAQACVLLAEQQQAKDEATLCNEIRQLVSEQKLDEAEKALGVALEAHPESSRLQSLHSTMYSAMQRQGRKLEAAQHIGAYVDYTLKLMTKTPARARGLAGVLRLMTSAYQQAGQPQAGLRKLDSAMETIRSLAKSKDGAEPAALLTELLGLKATLLVDLGRRGEAEKLVSAAYEAAQKAFAAKADQETILSLASALSVRADFLEKTAPQEADAAREKRLNFLAEQAKIHTDSAPIVSAYVNANLRTLSSLARRDATKAEQQLKGMEEFLKSIAGKDQGIESVIKNFARSLTSLKRRIEAAKLHERLIGQDAIPVEADAWVNGEALGEQDLKGKVVLLDFWAVWCGPCIATFPYLRQWQDKYADKGLIIIGMTRFYSYAWDEEAKRSKRVRDLSPSDEQAALAKFAQHHQLHYRFAVMPKESEFSKKYGVVGIPQAVVIDREGKIRLIRVGSGEQNARDLEEKIEQLLDAGG